METIQSLPRRFQSGVSVAYTRHGDGVWKARRWGRECSRWLCWLFTCFTSWGKNINSLNTIAVELLNLLNSPSLGWPYCLCICWEAKRYSSIPPLILSLFLPSTLHSFQRKFPADVSITFPGKYFEVYGLLVRQGSLQSPFPLDTGMPWGPLERGTAIWKGQLSECHRMPFRHFHPAGNEPVALTPAEGTCLRPGSPWARGKQGRGWTAAVVPPSPLRHWCEN